LCGFDPLSQRSFDHRKEWIQSRLETLAAVFAVDICGFAVLSNHLHLVLRIRPDVVKSWSDEEVARRWQQRSPRLDEWGQPRELEPQELAAMVANSRQVAKWRERLGSLSWFMGELCERIARQANREDGCKGRFWEGRFKSQALLDEAAVLACTMYVDLNPIRAGIADTPEASEFTSAFERIAARDNVEDRAAAVEQGESTEEARDGWLCPLPDADARAKPQVPEQPRPAPRRRASHDGFLPLRLDDYLRLLDWTGRQSRAGKRGLIPAHLQPILDRLQINAEAWVDTVSNFSRLFRRAAGRPEQLLARAQRAGCCWFHGLSHSRIAFG
jgi:REP element-mobilizing transposase RayT